MWASFEEIHAIQARPKAGWYRCMRMLELTWDEGKADGGDNN
jgi:hypothetical protein